MEIVYSTHAVERMQQRKITPADVENVIFNYDGKLGQSKDKTIYYKKIKDRKDNSVAAVVVKRKTDLLEVLTVMIHFEVKK